MIDQPLRALKDCGNVAARSLLVLYAGQDLDRWYGIPPDKFPWIRYTLEEIGGGASYSLGRQEGRGSVPRLS